MRIFRLSVAQRRFDAPHDLLRKIHLERLGERVAVGVDFQGLKDGGVERRYGREGRSLVRHFIERERIRLPPAKLQMPAIDMPEFVADEEMQGRQIRLLGEPAPALGAGLWSDVMRPPDVIFCLRMDFFPLSFEPFDLLRRERNALWLSIGVQI